MRQPAAVVAGFVGDDALKSEVLRKLPRIRSRWPKQVKLTKDVRFTLYEGERPVGIVGMKAGAPLTLLNVKVEHAIVQVQNSESPLPVLNTDLIEQLGGHAAVLALPDDGVASGQGSKATEKR